MAKPNQEAAEAYQYRWPEDTDQISFVRAGREHAGALNDLYNRVFMCSRPVADFEWKFWRSPAGPPLGVAAIERSSGRALAAAFGQRRRVFIAGAPYEVLMLCEHASDPAARAGGLVLKRTTHALAVIARQEGRIKCLYGGQSSDEAVTIGKRWFGYEDVFALQIWEWRLSFEPWLSARLGALGRPLARLLDPLVRSVWGKARRDIHCEAVTDFGAEFDELWERYRDRYRLCFARDSATLRWRWLDNPVGGHRILLARSEQGRPLGWIVWREWQSSGHSIATVLDLWAGGDAAVIVALCDSVRRAAATHGCVVLRFGVRPGSAELKAIEKMDHVRRSPYEKPDPLIVHLLEDEAGREGKNDDLFWYIISRTQDWYYTQGDSDFHD